MSFLVLKKMAAPPVPDVGEVLIFVDAETGHLKQMDENGLILDLLLPPRSEFRREIGLLVNPVGAGTTEAINCTAGADPHDLIVFLFGARSTSDAEPTITDDKGNTWQVDAIHRGPSGDNNLGFIASTGQDVGALAEGDTILVTFPVAPQASRLGYVEAFSGLDTTANRVHKVAAADWTVTDVADTGTTGSTTISRAVAVSLFVSGANGYAIDLNAAGTIGKYLPFPGGANLEAYGDFDKVIAGAYQTLAAPGAQRHVGHIASASENGTGLIVVYAAETV